MKKLIYLLIVVFIIEIITMVSMAYSESVTLIWDPNEEPEVIGYNIYFKNHINEDYHIASEIFEQDLDNPLYPEITFWGLNVNLVYYYVATAFSSDDESSYSNEVQWTAPTTPEPDQSDGDSGSGGGGGGGCFISSLM